MGADRYEEHSDYIIFPTICHNFYSEEANMKLYYYFNNKVFCCYTECNETFNIYELVNKRFKILGKNRVDTFEEKKDDNDYTFYDIILFISKNIELSFSTNSKERYISDTNKFLKKEQPVLQTYSNKILNVFSNLYPTEWIKEDISPRTMDYFDIKFSISRNSIIIPHYNINGELVGIRERALDKNQIESYGKYHPVEIEGKMYSHQLSLNLYGLDKVKDNIKRIKKVIIAEGEKSCLKSYEYYGNNSIMVASCGSHINKNQIKILTKNFELNEIIIAYDKEYTDYQSLIDYSLRMKEMCKKYSQYCNFSFIRDIKNLLQYKDSPIDRGKEKFEQLFNEREKVNDEI